MGGYVMRGPARQEVQSTFCRKTTARCQEHLAVGRQLGSPPQVASLGTGEPMVPLCDPSFATRD